MPTTYVDLEIGLHRREAAEYAVDLRYSDPESDTEVRVLQDASTALLHIDPAQLLELVLDPVAYGKALGEALFGHPSVADVFARARAVTESSQRSLRVRLFIGSTAPELYALRWETLRDPSDGASLLTNENVLFSRYLSSVDWRPVRLRPRGVLRALVVVADPSNIAAYHLASIDVPDEVGRARTAMEGIACTVLASGGSATAENLLAGLRDGCDILYLVCHGMLVKGEPWLWLEDAQGQVARQSGNDLATALREMRQRPRLVVLASCQSAGDGDATTGEDGVLAALGPRLAEAGVPAVVAMQGNVTIKTIDQFLPVFFRELQRDGVIDRALAVARGAVRTRPDSWMPVLFMRLKSGRLWYTPGFADAAGFQRWPSLLRSIQQQHCTPILGPGLLEGLLGATHEIARRWAETYNFPMALDEREALPQVAQFLAVNQGAYFLRQELADSLRRELLRRFGDELGPDQQSAPLKELINVVNTLRQKREPAEPHWVLAQLPLPVFITINPDDLLVQALRRVGKDPQVAMCPWNEELESVPTIFDEDPTYQPTPERPLVYYLFGQLDVPHSVVLTEDDYFKYLIGVTSNKELIPTVVRRGLADSALLFLGFQMDDWNFRVLFRSIVGQEGSKRRRGYPHVAAQVDPEEGRIVEPERARQYLDSYFKGEDISIYWGTTEDFTAELWAQWSTQAGGRSVQTTADGATCPYCGAPLNAQRTHQLVAARGAAQ